MSTVETKGWVRIVERLGISTVYALIAVFFLYRLASWTAPRADEFINKHFQTMDKLTNTAEEIEKTQKIGTEILQKLTNDGDDASIITKEHYELSKDIHKEVKSISSDIQQLKKAPTPN